MSKPKIKHTITKKEWNKKHKDFKLMGRDGIPYIMAYDSKIGTHLVPVKIVDESVNEGTKYKVGQTTPVGKIIGTSVYGKGRKQEWFYDVKKPGYSPVPYSEKSLDKLMGESIEEGIASTIDQIRQDSNDIRDFLKKVFSDSDFRDMKNDKDFLKYLKSIYEGVELESVNEGKKSKDSTGIRKVVAIYTNVDAIIELVFDDKKDAKEVVGTMGPVLVNAINATLKHKFKPTAGNEDKLKQFKSKLKELLKLVEALIKKPSKAGIKRLETMHRNWWNHSFGADIVFNGKYQDSIIESVNEMDINDPIMMKLRAAQMKRNKDAAKKVEKEKKINPDYKALKNATKIKALKKKRAEVMRDMEQEAEPEGGKIADRYGKLLNRIDNDIIKLGGNPMSESVNEAYVVMYAKKKGEKPAAAAFQLRGSALSFERDLKKDGYITMVTQKKVKGVDESVNESKEEVTPQQLLKIQNDVRKVNRKIKVYISKHPVTKGQLEIELGHGHDNDDEIHKIYAILKKHTGSWRTGTMFNESVNESNDVYHKSYTHAIEAAEVYAKKKGYEIEDDEMFTKVGMNSKRPSVGKTTRVSLELLKNGKPQRKMLHIQVYGMKNGYELNAYIN